MVNIQPTISKGKKLTRDMNSIKKLEAYFKKINSEGVYFSEFDGRKSINVIIDIPKGTKATKIIEPMFEEFNARILFQPVMTFNDLKKKAAKKK